MNISLSFAEYAAVNSIREVGASSFALLSTAKLGNAGDKRSWILEGEASGFRSLLADVKSARKRTLSSGMSTALEGVCTAIEGMAQAQPTT